MMDYYRANKLQSLLSEKFCPINSIQRCVWKEECGLRSSSGEECNNSQLRTSSSKGVVASEMEYTNVSSWRWISRCSRSGVDNELLNEMRDNIHRWFTEVYFRVQWSVHRLKPLRMREEIWSKVIWMISHNAVIRKQKRVMDDTSSYHLRFAFQLHHEKQYHLAGRTCSQKRLQSRFRTQHHQLSR